MLGTPSRPHWPTRSSLHRNARFPTSSSLFCVLLVVLCGPTHHFALAPALTDHLAVPSRRQQSSVAPRPLHVYLSPTSPLSSASCLVLFVVLQVVFLVVLCPPRSYPTHADRPAGPTPAELWFVDLPRSFSSCHCVLHSCPSFRRSPSSLCLLGAPCRALSSALCVLVVVLTCAAVQNQSFGADEKWQTHGRTAVELRQNRGRNIG